MLRTFSKLSHAQTIRQAKLCLCMTKAKLCLCMIKHHNFKHGNVELQLHTFLCMSLGVHGCTNYRAYYYAVTWTQGVLGSDPEYSNWSGRAGLVI